MKSTRGCRDRDKNKWNLMEELSQMATIKLGYHS